jgi:lauroyl/myristoyl acyltransferase
MKTLEEIRSGLWLSLRDGSKVIRFRLDEREFKSLVDALEAGGWVLMPREADAKMIEGGMSRFLELLDQTGSEHIVKEIMAAMVEARPR